MTDFVTFSSTKLLYVFMRLRMVPWSPFTFIKKKGAAWTFCLKSYCGYWKKESHIGLGLKRYEGEYKKI